MVARTKEAEREQKGKEFTPTSANSQLAGTGPTHDCEQAPVKLTAELHCSRRSSDASSASHLLQIRTRTPHSDSPDCACPQYRKLLILGVSSH